MVMVGMAWSSSGCILRLLWLWFSVLMPQLLLIGEEEVVECVYVS